MTEPIPPFETYVASLGRLTPHVDPTLVTPETEQIRAAAESLADLAEISRESLAAWALARPSDVPVLGLAVGLPQEKLKNALKDKFDTSGWVTLARQRSDDLVAMLDEEFDLVRLVEAQRHQVFKFGDVLVARGSGRQSANRAGLAVAASRTRSSTWRRSWVCRRRPGRGHRAQRADRPVRPGGAVRRARRHRGRGEGV